MESKTNPILKTSDVYNNRSYRSLYDSYNLSFYNNKAQNFDTDLLSIKTLDMKLETNDRLSL